MRVHQCRTGIFRGVVLIALLGLTGRTATAQLFEAVTAASPTSTAQNTAALVMTDGLQLLTAPTFVSGSGQVVMRSLARNPLTGDVVAIAGINGSGTLVHVDVQTATITPFGPPLTVALSSLAFDSKGQLYGFALCDSTYSNELFQLDPTGGNIIGLLGSLDSGRVAPCTSGLNIGGTIAIDPSTDVLYFASIDAGGTLFVDRMDSLLVPTLLYTNALFISPVLPIAATFAQGTLWLSTMLTQLGPGAGFVAVDVSGDGELTSGAAYWTVSFSASAPIFGLMPVEPACVPSATTACLYNRFKVTVNYDATPASGKGPATVLLESQQSVKFSFFDPGNIELILKILNACVAPYNKWWVSAGGLTNVGVAITVTDTQTGKVKTYSSAKNQLFQTFFDTAAFDCP